MATTKLTAGYLELNVVSTPNTAKNPTTANHVYKPAWTTLYDIQLVDTRSGSVVGTWNGVGTYYFSRDGWLVTVGGKQPMLAEQIVQTTTAVEKLIYDDSYNVSLYDPYNQKYYDYSSVGFSIRAEQSGDYFAIDHVTVTRDLNDQPAVYTRFNVYDPVTGWGTEWRLKENGANQSLDPRNFDLTPIFTPARDVIDFNKLTPEQIKKLQTGAPRYDASGGDDDVKLPDSANTSKTADIEMGGWKWNRQFEFGAGNGNDNVESSNGSDLVDLGDGDDIYTGSYGDDVVKGGKGNDIFDFNRLTAVRNLPGNMVELDGGDQTIDGPRGGDVLQLKGSSGDWVIVNNVIVDAGTPYADQEILIQSTKLLGYKGNDVPNIKFLVKNIESVSFQKGPDNEISLLKGSLTAELAKLAKEVYGPLPTLTHSAEPLYAETNAALTENTPHNKYIAFEAMKRGWHPVSALELGLPAAYLGPDTKAPKTFDASASLKFSMTMGHYQAKDDKDKILISPVTKDVPESNALVVTGVVNGKKTLVIAFRGTDQYADFDDYVNFSTHYQKYKPLLDKLPKYLDDNGITQVFATGHSLGGGMVEYFMADKRFEKYAPKAVTFGSPGSDATLAINDNRILNFVHTDDVVAKVPDVQGLIESIVVNGALAAGGIATATGQPVSGAAIALAASQLAAAFKDKDRHGVDIFINSAVHDSLKPDFGFLEHSMSLYVQEMVQLQQLAKAQQGQSIYGQSVYGNYWKNEFAGYQGSSGVHIALPKPAGKEIGAEYSKLLIVKSTDTFALGGLPNNTFLIRASEEVPTFIRIIDGGPAPAGKTDSDTIRLDGKVDDYFLQSNGYGGYDLMKLMPHGTPDIPIASVVSIERFTFGQSNLTLSFADFLKRGIPVQGVPAPDGDPRAGANQPDIIAAVDDAATTPMSAANLEDPFAAFAALGVTTGNPYATDGGRGFSNVYTAADLVGPSLTGPGPKDVLNLSGIDLSDFAFQAEDGNAVLMLNGKTINLAGIERIVFNEGVLALDESGMAGYAYRIYQAAFDRTPDDAGLSYWFDVLDKGAGMKVVADSFLLSDEFKKLYGNSPTNEQYIDLLYLNVLDRKADAPGYAYWNDYLKNGGTREEILIYFAESTENINNLKSELSTGIWFDT